MTHFEIVTKVALSVLGLLLIGTALRGFMALNGAPITVSHIVEWIIELGLAFLCFRRAYRGPSRV
ncbi:hypothetical protein [Brucella intermedia]|uniref:hypothetical protein n=1 Tax=Brucella intermedia TaxID=94625 RepID=UPI00165D0B80|nr:hypothetical protein [Brucella intermedia]QNQ39397.1 hypothetical protein IAR37_08400 [Brucella intermedia]